MFKNYFKIVLRRILRQKMNTTINILGLSVGIAASIIIFLFAHNELTYDQFNKNADQIYLIYKERITPTGTQITHDTWLPMADALKNEYADITNAVRVWDSDEWVESGDQKFQENITYADPQLLDIFTFSLVRGEREDISSDIHSAVISQQIAQKYFGDEDPIGKTLRIAFETDYIVRGVLAEIPQNSSIQINIMVSPKSAPYYERYSDSWGAAWLYTFLQLKPETPKEHLETQFPDFITKTWGEEEIQRTNLKLLALTDLHDEMTGARTNAYILLIIALIVLAIASINFMNLTTARSLERAREVGIRKVVGAERSRLIRQFLSESILISLLALVLGVVLVELFLPTFNSLYNLSLDLTYRNNAVTILALLGLALGVGFIAGIYPAFSMSRMPAIDTMRGQFKNSADGIRLRLGLVVAQFCLSIILIIATGVLWKQMNYMKNANLHFDKENVLAVPAGLNDFADPGAGQRALENFKNEIRQYGAVQSVSSSSQIPGHWPGAFTFVFPVEQGEERRLRMRYCAVDAHYFETYGMDFQEGHGFSEDLPAEAEQSVVVNEAAMRDFGWQAIEGHQIRLGDTRFNILGVVKDYHYDSLVEQIAPIIHFYRPPDNGRHRIISIKLAAGSAAPALDFIRRKWKEHIPDTPFNFFFVDDNFNRLYESQERLLKVAGVFSALAIFIAALGLFALSSLMIVQRTKEIGIRKVLGASVSGIIALLSKNFIRLVLLAIIIACPIAWYAMNKFLQNFAYRIEIGWWVFALAGGLVMLIALLTVSAQAIRAALANPVESLRYE